MTEITRLEKIANNFIETELKNYHLIVYHLGIELQDYIKNIEELNDKKTGTEILREYLKIKPSDEEIDNEIINADGDRDLLDLMRLLSEEPLIYELTQLVLRSKKVRIRRMHEIEKAGLEDPLLHNTWIYHKDSDLKQVLDDIVNEYDSFRIEDESEEENQNLK
jgi:hypothetical protein